MYRAGQRSAHKPSDAHLDILEQDGGRGVRTELLDCRSRRAALGGSAVPQEGLILLPHCTLARLICSPWESVQRTVQFGNGNKKDCNCPVPFFQSHPMGFTHK